MINQKYFFTKTELNLITDGTDMFKSGKYVTLIEGYDENSGLGGGYYQVSFDRNNIFKKYLS